MKKHSQNWEALANVSPKYFPDDPAFGAYFLISYFRKRRVQQFA